MKTSSLGSAWTLLVLLAALLVRPLLPASGATPGTSPQGGSPLPVIRSARLYLFQGNQFVGELLAQAQPIRGGIGLVIVGRFLGLRPGVYQARALGFTSLNGSGLPVARAAGTATVTAQRTVILRLQWIRLLRIEVTPAEPTIEVGQLVQFIATGFFSDGTREDLTQSVVWRSTNGQVALVGNGGVTGLPKGRARGLRTGNTTISATDPATSIQGSTTLRVRALLSITVTPTNQTILVGQSLQYTATGTFNDGSQQDITQRVRWSSSNPEVATINNVGPSVPPKGQARGVGPGATTITATDPMTNIQDSTSLNVRILVAITVTPANQTILVGQSLQYTATGTFSDGSQQDLTSSVNWSSSNTDVATINSVGPNVPPKGQATGVGPGSTTITATDPGTSVQGSTNLAVRILVSIAVTPANQTIFVGESLQYTATGTFSDGSQQDLTSAVNWSTGNPNLATISNGGIGAPPKGQATAVGAGTTSIIATDPATNVQGSTGLTIQPRLLSITVTPANQTILTGQSVQYTATGTFNDGSQQNLTNSVNWSSSNPSVAVISNGSPNPSPKGQATGVGAGTTSIIATDPATNVQGSTGLTIQPRLLSITVTPANQTILVGQSVQYTATGTFSNGSQQDFTNLVTWSSSNGNVATISNGGPSLPPKGQATGVGPGGTTITATDPATNIQGSTLLTVQTPTLVSITVTPANQTILTGQSIQYTATGNFSNGSQQDLTNVVNWSSSNGNAAIISNGPPSVPPKGQATGVGVGSTTITATDPATNIQGATTLTVQAPPPTLVSITVTPANQTITVGFGFQYTATGTFSNGSQQNLTNVVNWASSNTSVATISNGLPSTLPKGFAQGVGQGTTTITATDPATNIQGSTPLTVIFSTP